MIIVLITLLFGHAVLTLSLKMVLEEKDLKVDLIKFEN